MSANCSECGKPREYNGWPNYETWVVKLWLDNDEGLQNLMVDTAREHLKRADGDQREAAYTLREAIKEFHEENAPDLPNGIYSDLMNAALSEVSWLKIAEAYLEDLDEA